VRARDGGPPALWRARAAQSPHRGRRVRAPRGQAPALRAALAILDEPQVTRSEAERRLLELIRAAGLPAPHCNARVLGLEVDMVWPDLRMVVEIDGYAFHGTREAFERDRGRDARLLAAGYRVLRVTWRQIVDEPLRVIATIAAVLQPLSA
jgi:very-short-patch-repair endonuclease